MTTLLALLFACGGASPPVDWSDAADAAAGTARIEVLLDPDPPRQTANTAWLRVSRDGAPVTHGVTVDAFMPEMGAMPEMRSVARADHLGDGVWRAPFDLEMGGGWTLRVDVGDDRASFGFTVGARGLRGDGAPVAASDLDLADRALPPEVRQAVSTALGVAGVLADRLADDRLDGVAEALTAERALADAAPAADELAPWLTMGAEAARRLAGAADLTAARAALGELDRALLAAASADPRLREGWYVFHCPMTGTAFGKWVQRTPDLENPFMGRAMPGCGTPSTWTTRGPVPGQAGQFKLDAARRARFGVETALAERADLPVDVHALGRVVVDDTARVDATLRVGGVLLALHAGEPGASVQRGQPLVTLYSPALLLAAEDLLLTHRRGPSDPLAAAARRRLELLGVPAPAIDRVLAAGTAPAEWTLPASAGGVVLERMATPGQQIEAGMPIVRLAPLDQVWVETTLWPDDARLVQVGQPAQVHLPAAPPREARLDRLLPSARPEDQTRVARLVLQPADGLVPGAVVDVRFPRSLDDRLVVPASAVLYAGPRRVVFVEVGEDTLAARTVTVGARSGDRVEITSGLREGERVVHRGTFLVAAESRLRDAFPAEATDAAP